MIALVVSGSVVIMKQEKQGDALWNRALLSVFLLLFSFSKKFFINIYIKIMYNIFCKKMSNFRLICNMQYNSYLIELAYANS